MTNSSVQSSCSYAEIDGGRWTVAGHFLDALSHRDIPALATCLESDIRFRALVPPGTLLATGTEETVGHFRRWFGGEDDLEVVDASIGEVGSRLYLRWRIRLRSIDSPHSARVVEQHAFATVGELIGSLDLLCSGFQPD